MRTVQELRQMLEGVTWAQFATAKKDGNGIFTNSMYKRGNVIFYAKYGLHMNMPAVGIVAQDQYVAFTYVHRDIQGRDHHPVILTTPISPNQQRDILCTNDFAPHRVALVRLNGKKLELTDLVLRGHGHEN